MVHCRTKLQTVFKNIKVLSQDNVNYLYTYIYKQFIVIIMLQSLFNFYTLPYVLISNPIT